MSLPKVCLFAMLATALAFASAGRCGSLALPSDFLPVQSKNGKNLATGKVLVASRNLGDPHFAKSVILLVRYDADGVLGLVLNRRTDIPLSRVLDSLKGRKIVLTRSIWAVHSKRQPCLRCCSRRPSPKGRSTSSAAST